jgi:hypothetical protein
VGCVGHQDAVFRVIRYSLISFHRRDKKPLEFAPLIFESNFPDRFSGWHKRVFSRIT